MNYGSHRRKNSRHSGVSPPGRPACAWCPKKKKDCDWLEGILWVSYSDKPGYSIGPAGGTQWPKREKESLSPSPALLVNTSSSHYRGVTTNESPLVFEIWCIFSFSNSGDPSIIEDRELLSGSDTSVRVCGCLKGNHLAPLTCSSWPSLRARKVWQPRTSPKSSIFHSRN